MDNPYSAFLDEIEEMGRSRRKQDDRLLLCMIHILLELYRQGYCSYDVSLKLIRAIDLVSLGSADPERRSKYRDRALPLLQAHIPVEAIERVRSYLIWWRLNQEERND